MNGKTSQRALSHLGHVLAALRHRRGWSQEELARASALSVKTVVRYEESGRTPSMQTLGAVLSALDFQLGEVLLPEKYSPSRFSRGAERELKAQLVDLHRRLDRAQHELIEQTAQEASLLASELAREGPEPSGSRGDAVAVEGLLACLGELRGVLAIETPRSYAVQLHDLEELPGSSSKRRAANDS